MQQYDITIKSLLDKGKKEILKFFLDIEIEKADIIEELPQETVSIRSTDFPIRILEKGGKEYILLLEVQSYWKNEKLLSMLEYKVRFQKKYKLPVRSVMLLLKENKNAVSFYKDEELVYHFHLLKIWELDPEKVLLNKLFSLYPFVPLMKDGEKYIDKAESKIYNDIQKSEFRADLLTSLVLLCGLVDKNLAAKILERRSDIMIESPIYEIIQEKGIEKGIEEGKLEDARKMLEKGYPIEDIAEITGLTMEKILELKNV